MSRAERVTRGTDDVLTLDSGLDALRSSPSFRGPVESLDGHESNEHMALIYEDRDEQVAATVPYLVQGLRRGERCMCLLEEESKAAVLEGLRRADADVDVDEALESGALTFHTLEETYLRGGSFDGDEMIEFYEGVIDEATREYEALRIAASVGWLLEESTSIADFMAYESKVNDLFDGEDCIALCQYDRRRFPPEVLGTVIETHPHLVYDNTVCHNFYYTPPEEFFGPDQPDRELDRMMRTLVERTEAKASLHEREGYLHRQTEITADPDRSFEEKLGSLLRLGCERFDVELGGMAHVDPGADRFVLEHVVGEREGFVPGLELPLSETYCTAATGSDGPATVTDATGDDHAEVTVRREFGLEAYLGMHVEVEGDHDRTVFFVSTKPRRDGFSDEERTFHRQLSQWVGHELDRRQRERSLNDLYETAADTEQSFETKVERLLDLGRERFGLECGAFSRIAGDSFESVVTVGDHERFEDGNDTPLSETYCRRLFDRDGPLTVEHATEEGWEDDEAYEVWEYESYVGTVVTVGGEPYGTLCFGDGRPRSRPVSDDERTFLELMSHWIGYEVEREHGEAQLAALNEMARDVMRGETKERIAETAVEHAASNLRLPTTAVVSFDRDVGTLTPTALTDRAAENLPLEALCDDGPFWETFVENEVRVVDGVADLPDAGEHLTEAMAVPLGTHGLWITATTDEGGFCPAERDFVETTAATVETATVRADRERQLQKRERTLEEQNETLERLDRVNDIIRSIDQALVQASTRADVEAVVCEQLAAAGPYELAWVGTHDPHTGEVTARESAGDDDGFLDGLAAGSGDGAEFERPALRAVKTREPQVANDVLGDGESAWRRAALNRGYHASVALPLVYQDRCYGVLTIYAGQPGVFDELERSVLTELSETIAYAMNAVESKRALVSEETTVLEFSATDESIPLVRVARETGATLAVDTVVPRSDGRLRGYFTTRGVPAADVLELEPSLPLAELRLVAERDEDGESTCHFEATLHEESLAGTVVEHGARLRDARATGGSATVEIELAADADVREFVEMFRTRYPGSELVAQHSDERDYRTAAEFYAAVTDELTPRQLEAIQTAYFSGFFERPRPRTGGEIADAMDISQPTFNAHLRTAQRKLCRRLFETDPI